MPTELHSRLGTLLTACLDDHLTRRFGDRSMVINDVNVYPVKGMRNYYLLPDLFVTLDAAGRPLPEDRRDARDADLHRSYKLWQEPPIAFVLEIISPKTGKRDIEVKPALYEAMGVPEYWVFDSERLLVAEGLRCWRLQEGSYRPVALEPPPEGVGMPPATSRAPQEPLPSDNASCPSPSRPTTLSDFAETAKSDRLIGAFSEQLGLYFCIEDHWLWPYDPETGRVPTLRDRRKEQEAMAKRHDAMANRVAELEAELARLKKAR